MDQPTPDEIELRDSWKTIMEKLLDIDRQAAMYWKDPVRVSVRAEGQSRIARFEFEDELVAIRAEASKLSMAIALEKAGLRYQAVEACVIPKCAAGDEHRPGLHGVASEGALEAPQSDAEGKEGCSVCGAPEAELSGPCTAYACGGSDYDRRPGTCVCPTAEDDTPYEMIKVMRHWLSSEEFRGAMKFQIYRYTYRCGGKPGHPVERDLAKARFYLDALQATYDG